MGNLLSRLKEWWYEFPYTSRRTPVGRLWQRYVARGTQEWTKDGVLHRDGDKPARISPDGLCEWWFDGERHRSNDKPAVLSANGYRREWWVNGVLHRDGDKPAVVTYRYECVAELMWARNGEVHRDGNKPAYVTSNGFTEWWVHGTRLWVKNRNVFADGYQRFEFVAACLQF